MINIVALIRKLSAKHHHWQHISQALARVGKQLPLIEIHDTQLVCSNTYAPIDLSHFLTTLVYRLLFRKCFSVYLCGWPESIIYQHQRYYVLVVQISSDIQISPNRCTLSLSLSLSPSLSQAHKYTHAVISVIDYDLHNVSLSRNASQK